MAHQVVYDQRKASAASPYAEWKAIGRPAESAFIYAYHVLHDVARFVYVPAERLLYVQFDLDDGYELDAVARVVIDEDRRVMRVEAADCKAESYWPIMFENNPTGEGKREFFRMCMNELFMEREISSYMAEPFFGPGWAVEFAVGGDDAGVTERFKAVAVHWLKILPRSNWGDTVAHFDFAREEEASTKIGAAFRGWCDRRKYRHDPTNSFGRFVALRIGGFA